MKKIIQVEYCNIYLDDQYSVKFFLIDWLELDKLQEQEKTLYGNHSKLTFTEFSPEVAKFLPIERFKSTELIEFIKIMDFIKFNEKL